MIEFVTNRKVLIGENSIKQIPAQLKWYGKEKPLLVVYSNQADVVKKLEAQLTQEGFAYSVYDKVQKEPDLDIIDSGAAYCLEQGCDSVVAIGGGSVIDTSKMIAMLATNGGRTEQYQLEGRTVEKIPLLFIAVPTTAGTGAEATKVSVVFNQNKGYKKSVYDNSMIAEIAVLDPETIVGLPPKVTASTGMDAITHAIEAYTSLNANVVSRMYSIKALDLLTNSIVTAYNEPENLEARTNMLLGSYFAGIAIAVGTCLAHIVGQPFGAIYGIPHGDACSIFLLPSMRMNKNYCLDKYVELAKSCGIDPNGKTKDEMFEAFVAYLDGIAGKINAPRRISQYIDPAKVDVDYAVENVATSMAHIKHNPRPVSRELFRELILEVL